MLILHPGLSITAPSDSICMSLFFLPFIMKPLVNVSSRFLYFPVPLSSSFLIINSSLLSLPPPPPRPPLFPLVAFLPLSPTSSSSLIPLLLSSIPIFLLLFSHGGFPCLPRPCSLFTLDPNGYNAASCSPLVNRYHSPDSCNHSCPLCTRFRRTFDVDLTTLLSLFIYS